MNRRKYFIFDFETDGPDPLTCNPVQVAAVVIDPMKLEVIPGSEFNMMMKPPGIENLETYLTDEKNETLMFHSKHQKKEPSQILADWAAAPDQKLVWQMFSNFVNKFNYKGTEYWAPVPGGANIAGFDIIIADRLNKEHDIKTMFWKRDCDLADVQRMAYHWFEGLSYGPKDYKVDTLRKFFQMPADNAHDALQDVKDCANLIIRFLSLSRLCAKKVEKFKEYAEALKKESKK